MNGADEIVVVSIRLPLDHVAQYACQKQQMVDGYARGDQAALLNDTSNCSRDYPSNRDAQEKVGGSEVAPPRV